MDVPVERVSLSEGGGVEHEVVGDVTNGAGERSKRFSQGDPDAGDIVISGGVKMRGVVPRDHQHLVGCARPVGAQHDDVRISVDHPLVDRLLGLDGGALQTMSGDPGEPGLLLGDLSGDEAHPEELAMGVLD